MCKVRFIDKQNDKTFRQYSLSSKGGWVSRKKAGRTPILYRLNTLATADEIFLVNGEKAADRGAAELGIVTTCVPDGEGKWWGDYTQALVAKLVRVVIDRDEKGEAHGKVERSTRALPRGVLRSGRLVQHQGAAVVRVLPPVGHGWCSRCRTTRPPVDSECLREN
jgi:hypothetical protein